jgi:RNA polymerase sigma-70 factor (ECF subfamily)
MMESKVQRARAQLESETADEAALLQQSVFNPSLFSALYEQHSLSTLRYFAARTADAEIAADLTAETFASAFAGRAKYRAELGSPAAWLFGIARNQLRHFERWRRVDSRNRRLIGLPDVPVDDNSLVRIEELIDFEALRQELRATLVKLGPSTAEALRLRIVEELPYQEVARHLGCSEGAARTRVARGLARAHRELEGQP